MDFRVNALGGSGTAELVYIQQTCGQLDRIFILSLLFFSSMLLFFDASSLRCGFSLMLVLFNASSLRCFLSSALYLFDASSHRCFFSSMLLLCNPSSLRCVVSLMLVLFDASSLRCFVSSNLHLFDASSLQCFFSSILLLFNASSVWCFFSSMTWRVAYVFPLIKNGMILEWRKKIHTVCYQAIILDTVPSKESYSSSEFLLPD